MVLHLKNKLISKILRKIADFPCEVIDTRQFSKTPVSPGEITNVEPPLCFESAHKRKFFW